MGYFKITCVDVRSANCNRKLIFDIALCPKHRCGLLKGKEIRPILESSVRYVSSERCSPGAVIPSCPVHVFSSVASLSVVENRLGQRGAFFEITGEYLDLICLGWAELECGRAFDSRKTFAGLVAPEMSRHSRDRCRRDGVCPPAW
eukprot:scaffold305421_cov40-Prasinocladus_malaysianus.AAC.1